GDGPATRPPRAASWARSATDRCDRTDLIRAPAISRWITCVSAQNVTVRPERAGPSQNCLPATCRFPLAGTTRSNSTGPPGSTGTAAGTASGSAVTAPAGSGCAGAVLGGGTSASTPRHPQPQHIPLLFSNRSEPV